MHCIKVLQLDGVRPGERFHISVVPLTSIFRYEGEGEVVPVLPVTEHHE
jgi:hypothetical protein